MSEEPTTPAEPISPPSSALHSTVKVEADLPVGARLQVTVTRLPGTGGDHTVLAQAINVAGQVTPLTVEITADAQTTRQQVAVEPASAAAPLRDKPLRLPTLKLPTLPKIELPASWRSFASQRALGLPELLFAAGLLLVFITHLVGVLDFPIYFSCDEAVDSVIAADLVQNRGKDAYGEFLPTFFRNDSQYSQSTSVYLRVAPYILWGQSAWMTRALFALLSLLGLYWVSALLRRVYQEKHWWLGVMLLAVIPTWFLHSRTAFEYCLMASLYAGFLYYYQLYRLQKPRYLYLALVLGALAFYTYTPGQIVVVITGLVLFFSDLRYHWQQRATGFKALGLLALLTLPLVRFIITHPSQYADRLRMYGSFLVQDLPATKKFGMYLSNYLYGLSPIYWFFPNDHDIPRYVMKGYGHLGWWLLPFFLIGLWRAIRRFKQPAYRILPLLLLAAPAGAAMVGITVNRMIMITIPAVLLGAIGVSACLDWLALRWQVGRKFLPVAVFVGLALAQVLMLRDVMVNGPTWYSDYGLSGMQFGARQVFQAADRYQKAHPDLQVAISPNWTFQGDTLRRFFVPDNPSIRIGTTEAFQREIKPEIFSFMFVLIPKDYEAVQASNRFAPPVVDETIYLPNGQPGFYFTRLQYRADIDQVIADEAARRHVLVYSMVNIQGEQVKVGVPTLDMGSAQHAFDGNPDTLLRTREANPLTLDLEFSTPRQVSGVVLRVGGETVDVTITLTLSGGGELLVYTRRAGEVNGYKDVTVDFDAPVTVSRLQIDLLDTYSPDPSNVHLWEVTLK